MTENKKINFGWAKELKHHIIKEATIEADFICLKKSISCAACHNPYHYEDDMDKEWNYTYFLKVYEINGDEYKVEQLKLHKEGKQLCVDCIKNQNHTKK